MWRTLLGVMLAIVASCAAFGGIACVLVAVAMPQYDGFVLPRQLVGDFQVMRLIVPYAMPMAVAGIIPGMAVGIGWILLLNRHWASGAILNRKALFHVACCCLGYFILYGVTRALGDSQDRVLPYLDKTPVSQLGAEWLTSPFGVSSMLVTALWAFGAYALMSEAGLAGTNPRRLSRASLTPEGARKILFSTIAVTVVLAAFRSISEQAIRDAFALGPEAALFFLDQSGEFTLTSLWIYSLSMVLVVGLPTATQFGVTIALAPGPSPLTSRAVCLVLALLPGGVGASYAHGFVAYCLEQGEMSKPNLTVAADLEPAGTDQILVVPTADGPTPIAYSMELDILDGEVRASWNNYDGVVRYLEDRKDHWTKHTFAAWQSRGAMLDRLFYPERGVEERVQTADAADSIIDTMIAIARLRHMPQTKGSVEAARRFLDPDAFSLPPERGQPAPLLLVDLALHADDLPSAQRLWEQTSEKGKESMPRPDELPWRGGRIEGHLVATTCGTQGIRIGLYLARDEPAQKASVPSVTRLLAATAPNANGAFEFTGLRAATYDLALLLPSRFGTDAENIQVAGTLGGFKVAAGEGTVTAPQIQMEARDCLAGSN